MRRFRYGDPAKQGFKRYSTYAYIFLTWNVLGYVIYTVWQKKKEKTTPEWKAMSSTDKYLSMMTMSKNIERVKISGFKTIERSKVESNPPTQVESES